MLYLTIIVVNVVSLFFQIYNIEDVEISIHYFCVWIRFADFNVLTEMKQTTIHYFTFHTIDITKYILIHS